mmetsp:Transcript_79431/g.125258  ORF Transcript_79431/g.125258 Transcript_79431/m.125258 type:complete len:275 (+) Transcript_79431:343-1167(+)
MSPVLLISDSALATSELLTTVSAGGGLVEGGGHTSEIFGAGLCNEVCGGAGGASEGGSEGAAGCLDVGVNPCCSPLSLSPLIEILPACGGTGNPGGGPGGGATALGGSLFVLGEDCISSGGASTSASFGGGSSSALLLDKFAIAAAKVDALENLLSSVITITSCNDSCARELGGGVSGGISLTACARFENGMGACGWFCPSPGTDAVFLPKPSGSGGPVSGRAFSLIVLLLAFSLACRPIPNGTGSALVGILSSTLSCLFISLPCFSMGLRVGF